MRLFFLGLIALMLSSNLHAWQLSLQTDDSGETFITASSSVTLSDVQVYLTWFNLDTAEVQSWTIAKGWQTGVVPIIDEVVVNVTTFAEQVVAALPASCDSTESCFVSFVAVPEGIFAANSAHWQAGTVLPLTARAGQARLAGQQFFLPVTESIENSETEIPVRPADGSVFSGDYGTEKPDVVRLVGQYLYYANIDAERLQVIDLSDLTAPRLLTEQRLENVGTPRELYVLNERVLLLQETEQGLRMSVWQLSADQQLQALSQQELSGGLITSRRRDDVVYTALISTNTVYLNGTEITAPEEVCRDCVTLQNIDIYAVQVTEDGQLNVLGQTQLPNYSYGFIPGTGLLSGYYSDTVPKISIFEEYLVLISRQPQNWYTSLIQVISLGDETQPLRALPSIQLAGVVDSEFQFQVSGDVLRVLYEATGSAQGIDLAVIDLSLAQPSLIGQLSGVVLDNILQSARFVDDTIFLMTQQMLGNVNTASLWVINVADPSAPTLLSSMPLPVEAGDSDQLFSSNTRLLSIGVDTVQTAADIENNMASDRMSLSLFDTSDPTNPRLISHFVPLQSEVTLSTSLASQDEQAFFVDWEQAYAALPLVANVDGHYYGLQMVSFADDVFSDEGYVGSNLSFLERSMPINENQLVSVGYQDLLSVQWGNGSAQVLGSLELTQHVNQLQAHAGMYWASSSRHRRFYRYADQDAMQPAQTWTLETGYPSKVMDETQAIFYTTYNTPSFQRLRLDSGELQTPVDMVMSDVVFDRTNALLTTDALHFGELIQVNNTGCFSETVCVLPSWSEWVSSLVSTPKQWVLKSWPVEGGQSEPVVRSITGKPVAFTAEGLLITEEGTLDGQLRLSLLSLSEQAAHLVSSAVLPCKPTFERQDNYASTQLMLDATQGSLWLNCTGSASYQMSSTEFEHEMAQNVTRVYRLDPAQQFAITGEWSFLGHKVLQMVADNTLMFRQSSTRYIYSYTEAESFDDVDMQLTINTRVSNMCQVFDVTESEQFNLLSEFPSCPSILATVFSPHQMVVASEYAGLKTISW